MSDKNIKITTDENSISTNDELLNRIIRAVETETGSSLAMAIPAIEFEDDPDEKIYIILLKFYEDDVKDWSIKVGRQSVYDYLKFLIEEEQIDPNTSFIISCDKTETFNGKDNIKPNSIPITVFRFMKVMFEDHKILDGSTFDINEFDHYDYINGDKTILEI